MRLKVPFQKNDIPEISPSWMEKIIGHDRMQLLRQINPLVVKDPELDDKSKYFMADFRGDRISMFLNYKNKEKFFEDADRAYIAHKICSSTRFGDGAQDYGLEKLILDGVYQAGYFPHDGPVYPEATGEPVLPEASDEPEPVLPEAPGEPGLPEAAGGPVLSEAAGKLYTNDRQRLKRDGQIWKNIQIPAVWTDQRLLWQ